MQLADIDDKILTKALHECPKKFTWVPEIAEFKRLCLSFIGNNTEGFYLKAPKKPQTAQFPSKILMDYCVEKGISWK